MIPAVILAFLIGTVLAPVFRGRAPIPGTCVSFFLSRTFELLVGESGLTAFQLGLLFATAPQTGYFFSPLARNRLFRWRFIEGRLVSPAPTSAIVTTLRADKKISK